jgi:hypothetical protein
MAAPKTGLHYVGLDGKRHELSGPEFPAIGGADRVIAEALCSWSSVQLRNQGIDEQNDAQHAANLRDAARAIEVERVGEDEEPAEQVERLAKAITDLDVGEPSRDEGAVDTAIRMLREAYDTPSRLAEWAAREVPQGDLSTDELVDALGIEPAEDARRALADDIINGPVTAEIVEDDGSEVGEEFDSREPLVPPARVPRPAPAGFGDNIPF